MHPHPPYIPPRRTADPRVDPLEAERDELTDFLRSLRSSRARLRRISPTEVLVHLDDEQDQNWFD